MAEPTENLTVEPFLKKNVLLTVESIGSLVLLVRSLAWLDSTDRILQNNPTNRKRPFMTDSAPTKTIHFCADEWMLLLEALHSYKDTNDGRKVAGRLNWVRAKLEDCRAEECLIRLSA